MYDLIIVGGGIAGLTAAIYADSRSLKTLIIEKERCGGVIGRVSKVSHYPGVDEGETGEELTNKILAQLIDSRVDIKFEKVSTTSLHKKIKTVTTENGTYEGKALIIANGRTADRIAADEGNVSYNAVKDAEKYKGKDIFIVGGSDGALKEALYLASICKHVNIVHHGKEVTAIEDFVNAAKEYGNIDFYLNSEIKKIDKKSVTLITNGKTKKFDGEYGVFAFIGGSPNTEIYPKLRLHNKYVVVDRKMATNFDGVWACGDIIDKEIRQLTTAAAEATIAVMEVKKYLAQE